MLVVWKRSPLLRILLPFVLGITNDVLLKPNFALMVGMLICFALTASVLHFRKRRLHYNQRHVPAVIYAALFFVLGNVVTSISDERIQRSYYGNYILEGSIFHLQLLDAPVEKEKSVKLICEVIGVTNENANIASSGKLLVYLQKDSGMTELFVDDVILCYSNSSAIATPGNPHEFDYAAYQSRHHIYFQTYAKKNQWQFFHRPDHHSFMGWFITWREKLLDILKRSEIEEREFDVLAALVLGKSSGIDSELMNAYAGVGAVHVLAVSGLHVALIYVLLSPLMKRFFRNSNGRVLKTLIPIVLLWIYAGITGFSPSVLRAALMFSFFIVADNFQKQNNIYNTMSASALVLLIVNPMMLFELGFQLSYLAVLGIVVLQQKILNLIYPPNKVMLWLWKMTAVSIAAQIATFPITIYYFHQFPNYFLLSNFLVIPLSTLILYTALTFFTMCWYAPVGHFLAHVSAFLTRIMNDLMVWMSSWPYSLTNGISISTSEFLILSLALIFACSWFFWKKSKALLPLLFCFCCISVLQLIEKHRVVMQHEICFHSLRGQTCITYANGNSAAILCSESLLQDDRAKKFHFQSYWHALGLNKREEFNIQNDTLLESMKMYMNYPLLQLGEHTILYVDSSSVSFLDSLHADIFVFGSSVFLKESDLDGLIGKSILIDHQVKNGLRNKLWEKLQGKSKMFDLRDGAVIVRDNELAHFSAFYH